MTASPIMVVTHHGNGRLQISPQWGGFRRTGINAPAPCLILLIHSNIHPSAATSGNMPINKKAGLLKESGQKSLDFFEFFGRGDWIRTSDPLRPRGT